MKILHTSDLHIGRSLYGTRRYKEYKQFLDWLIQAIEQNNIDVLLISGDIFDTSAPSAKAQELYYEFLCNASKKCKHIIITAGNHDSPSFLEAPKGLLKVINTFIVANINDDIENEVILIKNDTDNPELIVCAIPYLRDRDIRSSEAGETFTDKNKKVTEGIKKHYNAVFDYAENLRKEIFEKDGNFIPIISMGHLFTAGGKTTDGDGVRELYIGTLAHVDNSLFRNTISYTALGHLHVPQKVGDNPFIRYSGSPLAIGFNEANQKKTVICLELNKTTQESQIPRPEINKIEIPKFQKLKLISGDLEKIKQELSKLKQENANVWVEIQYTGKAVIGNLKEEVEILTKDSNIEVLRIQNKQIIQRTLSSTVPEESLDKLSERDVFKRCLESAEIPQEQIPELENLYNRVLTLIHEQDKSDDNEN